MKTNLKYKNDLENNNMNALMKIRVTFFSVGYLFFQEMIHQIKFPRTINHVRYARAVCWEIGFGDPLENKLSPCSVFITGNLKKN